MSKIRPEWVPAFEHVDYCPDLDAEVEKLSQIDAAYQAANDALGRFFARANIIQTVIKRRIPDSAKEGDKFPLCSCGYTSTLRKTETVC